MSRDQTKTVLGYIPYFESLHLNTVAVELVDKRTENSKSFLIGPNKIAVDASFWPVHYKENEYWLDINYSHYQLRSDHKLYTKGPLIIREFNDGRIGYEVESRKTGHKIKVELEGDAPEDVEFELVKRPCRVGLWKIIKSARQLKQKWRVTETNKQTGKDSLNFRLDLMGYDNAGDTPEIIVDVENIDENSFFINEKFTGVVRERDEEGKGAVKKAEYPIRIDVDVDVDVGASADDCYDLNEGSYWSTSSNRFNAGVYSATYHNYLSGARWQLNIPQDANVSVAYMRVQCQTVFSGTQCYTKLEVEETDSAAAFTTYANFIARSRYAKVDWDISEVWAESGFYNTPSLVTPFNLLFARSGWAANNYAAVFWDNDGSPVTANNLRRGYSYDGVGWPPRIHIEYSPAVLLSGSITGTSSLSGTLDALVPISGTISTSSVLSGVLEADVPILGSIDATTALSATLSINYAIDGSIDAQSLLTALLSRSLELIGQISASSILSGSLGVGRPLQGSVDALGTLAGVLSATVPLSGNIDAQSTLTGDLLIPEALSGVIAATSALTGNLIASVALQGDIPAQSALSAALTRDFSISGVIPSVSILSGFLEALVPISGFIVSQSTLTASLALHAALSGLVAGLSSLSGTMIAERSLSGSCDAISVLVASLSRDLRIRGSIDAQSVLEAILTVITEISGSIDAASTLQATLKLDRELKGIIECYATLIGTLTVPGQALVRDATGHIIVDESFKGFLESNPQLGDIITESFQGLIRKG